MIPVAPTNPEAADLQLPPLSLYIHIPWCIRKCPYCDFNSHALKNELPETQYVQALLKDLTNELHSVQGRNLRTIFIGGGTPSLMSAKAYAGLFEGLQKHLTFSHDIEITMEANPGTFEQERFNGFRAAGINRLSIGVQSFDNACLKKLGRIHSGNEAQQAVYMARKAGFDNINLDLMHGLPGQTENMAMQDLDQAIKLAPEHLSWYQLTIEPNTMFWTKPPKLPEDETLWSIQEKGQQKLARHGFTQYEISAYSQKGRRARHNLNYWQFGDFIGIGAGAHGKLTNLATGTIKRNWKTRSPSDYLSSGRSYQAGERQLDKDDLPVEFMMNVLRLKEGVVSRLFSQRTGLPINTIQPPLEKARNMELLTEDSLRLQPSEKGSLFLNELLELFC